MRHPYKKEPNRGPNLENHPHVFSCREGSRHETCQTFIFQSRGNYMGSFRKKGLFCEVP